MSDPLIGWRGNHKPRTHLVTGNGVVPLREPLRPQSPEWLALELRLSRAHRDTRTQAPKGVWSGG